MPLSGMQQICVQSGAVPPEEKNKRNFNEIQQSSDCEYSEILDRINCAAFLSCEQHDFLFGLHKLCRRGSSVFYPWL